MPKAVPTTSTAYTPPYHRRALAYVAGSEPAAPGLLSPAAADQRGDHRGTSQILSRRSWIAVASTTPLICAGPAFAKGIHSADTRDAELICASKTLIAGEEAMRRLAEANPLARPWKAVESEVEQLEQTNAAALDTIEAATATSVDGLRAKARAAAAIAERDSDGQIIIHAGPDEILWSLVRDLVPEVFA